MVGLEPTAFGDQHELPKTNALPLGHTTNHTSIDQIIIYILIFLHHTNTSRSRWSHTNVKCPPRSRAAESLPPPDMTSKLTRAESGMRQTSPIPGQLYSISCGTAGCGTLKGNNVWRQDVVFVLTI